MHDFGFSNQNIIIFKKFWSFWIFENLKILGCYNFTVPYFSGINPALAENPIFYILMFQDPNDVRMTWKFTSISFWRSVGAKEANKRRPEGQDRWAHMAIFLGHVGPTILGLEPPMPSIFFPQASSWPKNDYKNSLPTPFEIGRASCRERVYVLV